MLGWLPHFACIVSVSFMLSVGVSPARAEIDLTLWSEGDSYLRPTIPLDSAFFGEHNAWFGESREHAGDHVGWWGEFGAMPGLEGALTLGSWGTVRGRVSGVWTTTQIGLDAAGSNFDDRHPSKMTIEDAYIGWSSGDLFPSLGKHAIDLSVGAQKYQVGSGFLFWDGGTDGGTRGGYWIAMRKAFQLTAIAKLETGPFKGEVVYLQPNDVPDSSTDIVGTNLEWRFSERASAGAGYWFFADSDDFRRDGLHVVDLRGEVKPLASLPGLVLSAELAYEKNGRVNESWGGYTEIGHSFDEVCWKPYLSFRYSGFTGDRDGDDEIEAFDPIYYAFSDWDTWYLGEIFGEYIGTNRNLDAYTVRLRTEPAEGWTVNLVGLAFVLDEFATEIQPRLFDPRVVSINDKYLGYEADLAVDWALNDHLAFSFVLAALFPGKGLEQATGGDSVWMHAMFYASISF
jgi:hypothetical protein